MTRGLYRFLSFWKTYLGMLTPIPQLPSTTCIMGKRVHGGIQFSHTRPYLPLPRHDLHFCNKAPDCQMRAWWRPTTGRLSHLTRKSTLTSTVPTDMHWAIGATLAKPHHQTCTLRCCTEELTSPALPSLGQSWRASQCRDKITWCKKEAVVAACRGSQCPCCLFQGIVGHGYEA